MRRYKNKKLIINLNATWNLKEIMRKILLTKVAWMWKILLRKWVQGSKGAPYAWLFEKGKKECSTQQLYACYLDSKITSYSIILKDKKQNKIVAFD